MIAIIVSAGALAGCNPDPSTGRPPPTGAVAAPYTTSVHAVGPGTQWPLAASWRPGCPVGPENLRLVELTHWGYDGQVHTGQIVVHAWVVPAVIQIFGELYAARVQIERMTPVDAFGGDDDASMAANNTSAFNCRKVARTTSLSEHASGLAIDLNPVQNPYVHRRSVDPPAGRSWLDREFETPGMVRSGDVVVRSFAAGGFGWGGSWTGAKDYQHFSTSGR